jgi:hypothetical protein
MQEPTPNQFQGIQRLDFPLVVGAVFGAQEDALSTLIVTGQSRFSEG